MWNIVPESNPRFDSEFDTIYNHGYGEPAGCFGINCQHMPYPYIKGVSHNFQKQYDPDEAVKNANIQAKQRYYERKVRALKKKWVFVTALVMKSGARSLKVRFAHTKPNNGRLLKKTTF